MAIQKAFLDEYFGLENITKIITIRKFVHRDNITSVKTEMIGLARCLFFSLEWLIGSQNKLFTIRKWVSFLFLKNTTDIPMFSKLINREFELKNLNAP